MSENLHNEVRALASRHDAEAIKLLADAANSEDQFLRRTAIEVIGSHPLGHSLRPLLLEALSEPSAYVVRTACDIVAAWKLREAHALIVNLATAKAASTRQSAIRALDAIWADGDFALIFETYAKDPDPGVRRDAAWVLRAHAKLENWRTLFDSFYVDELARHRQWACELAEAFVATDTLPVLAKLSADADGHVRKAASHAMEVISSKAL